MYGVRFATLGIRFEPKLGFYQINDELLFLRSSSDHLTWFDLKLELIVALNCDLGELPYVLEILDLESSEFGQP